MEVKLESLQDQFGLERGGRDKCGQEEDACVKLLLVDSSQVTPPLPTPPSQGICVCIRKSTHMFCNLRVKVRVSSDGRG